MSQNKYDIAILGTGLGGLVCGYILSKNGFKVLLLEKEAQIGGCLQTFRRFGIKFDTGMHYIGSMLEGQILHRLFKLALPVSAASIMLPVVSNLDLAIVPQRLEVAGYTVNQATELFGYLTGMAVPLVNLSTIITASLAVSIIPIRDRVARHCKCLPPLQSPQGGGQRFH